jgi:hypothetical protein
MYLLTDYVCIHFCYTVSYRWGDICPCLDCCVGAECAVLGGENRKGEICEHPYYLDRIALNLDVSHQH